MLLNRIADTDKPFLSILIASIEERSNQLKELLAKFERQRGPLVEIVTCIDNKEMSIGKKRQQLLEASRGKWIVFFDDDDDPAGYYVRSILQTGQDPSIDCMGINGIMSTNGMNMQTWCHRLGYPWAENQKGFDYIRPIIHFNPVLRSKALQAGFKDMRFGEDRDYADRLNKLLTKEAYIESPLFHYRYSNKIEHNKKYGIKR